MPVTILQRSLPALLTSAAAILSFAYAPPQRKVTCLVLATAFGLCGMEAEYCIAHGLPWFDMPFFAIALGATLIALCAGAVGGFALGVMGLTFFTYVNDRFCAPYLLDYVLPSLYAWLIIVSRKKLNWIGRGILVNGIPEGIWWLLATGIAIFKTSVWHKWDWVTGKPW